ncbi:alpha/beta fold hydrolase [Streptomyces sp. NPDC051907]|uniref:thioesterase II family protein n=1 Tax=Streptomyces sp. NPDC051907 TaxID=3155284 RepID=UPI0034334CFC
MAAETMTSRGWIRRHPGRPGAPLLVCFPHAGGGASSYQGWAAALKPEAEVLVAQYPGREERFNEPLVDDMGVLADAIFEALPVSADRPLVLFGHSMGSAVAYEVARRIERACPGALAGLCVSGRPAPHAARRSLAHTLPDDELIAEVKALAGTSDDILDSDEFQQLFLPVIRNDYRLIETLRPAPPTVLLDAPVSAFCGTEDPHVVPAEMESWREVTRGAFDSTALSGGHFYLTDHLAEIVAAVARHLRPAAR